MFPVISVECKDIHSGWTVLFLFFLYCLLDGFLKLGKEGCVCYHVSYIKKLSWWCADALELKKRELLGSLVTSSCL